MRPRAPWGRGRSARGRRAARSDQARHPVPAQRSTRRSKTQRVDKLRQKHVLKKPLQLDFVRRLCSCLQTADGSRAFDMVYEREFWFGGQYYNWIVGNDDTVS